MKVVCKVCLGVGKTEFGPCIKCDGSGKMSAEQDLSLVQMMLAMSKEEETTRETYVKSPIPYPGCKYESLNHIIPRLPKANKFIDGCGGSGVVMMNLHHNYPLKIFNDRHAGVVAFFRCIRDKEACERLIERLDLTVHAREEFIWCRDSWQNCNNDVERAARWYYSVCHSFSALGRAFARSTNTRAQHDLALHNKLPMLRSIRTRFAGVQVENLDVLQCIRDYADHNSVAYIDPDYIGTDPGIYEHKVKHEQLLDLIFDSPGYFAVSGYTNPLYEDRNWSERIEWDVTTRIRSKAFTENNNLEDKSNVMRSWQNCKEVLWIKDFD